MSDKVMSNNLIYLSDRKTSAVRIVADSIGAYCFYTWIDASLSFVEPNKDFHKDYCIAVDIQTQIFNESNCYISQFDDKLCEEYARITSLSSYLVEPLMDKFAVNEKTIKFKLSELKLVKDSGFSWSKSNDASGSVRLVLDPNKVELASDDLDKIEADCYLVIDQLMVEIRNIIESHIDNVGLKVIKKVEELIEER